MVVGGEREWHSPLFLQPGEHFQRLIDGEFVLRRLRQNADEAQFRDGAGEKRVACAFAQTPQPQAHARMELVFEETERDQRVDVEKVSRGRLDRIS